jgi:hypothetical protein
MSDIVKQIREGLESQIGLVLPNWTVLDNKFDLEKNNFNNQSQRYGVNALDGAGSVSILKFYTNARNFNITLCQSYISGPNSDTAQQAAVDILEDAMDEIIKTTMGKKAGSPFLAYNVFFDANGEIDFETIENLAILNFSLTVEYRNLLSS